MKNKGLLVTALLSVILTACGGSDSSSSSSSNHAPIASAGADQTIELGKTVNLDGSASSDADQDSLGYTWALASQPSGSVAVLSDALSAKPSFVPDKVGTYTVNLKVDDGRVYSAMDAVDIVVTEVSGGTPQNHSPLANAGADRTVGVKVLGSDSVDIMSSSSDPDGDTLSYKWVILKQPSTHAKLTNSEQKTVTLTPDAVGVYELQLDVSDGKAISSDTVQITISKDNQPPTANAGADQQANVKVLGSDTIYLTSLSTDPENDTLTYQWSMVKQPSTHAKLTNSNQATVGLVPDVVGVYELQLQVNDGTASSTDTVQITVTRQNQAPVAKVTDQDAVQNTVVTLDGSASSDPDNDALNYQWYMESAPEGSTAKLSSTTSSSPTFTPDMLGTYSFQLKVNDGTANSATVSTSVKVHAKIDQLKYSVVDAEFSTAKDRIIIASTNPNQLHIYDPITLADQTIALADVPTSVSVSPDGFYAVVGMDKKVAYADLNQATLLKTIDVSAKVLDLVFADNGYAYAFPKADGVEGIYSINLDKGSVVVDPSTKTRTATLAKLRVKSNGITSLYGVAGGVSPSMLEKFDISSGTAKFSGMKGMEDACGNLWVAADGATILTACGKLFRAADGTTDLSYLSAYDLGKNFLHTFSSNYVNRLLAIPVFATTSGNEDAYVRDYSKDVFLDSEAPTVLPAFVINKKAFLGHGRFVFANTQKMFAIMQADKSSGLVDQYGVTVLDLPYLP